jgi:hypothetical protein
MVPCPKPCGAPALQRAAPLLPDEAIHADRRRLGVRVKGEQLRGLGRVEEATATVAYGVRGGCDVSTKNTVFPAFPWPLEICSP